MTKPLPPIPWEQKRTKQKPKKKPGLLVDLRRCTGCHACSVACKTEHNVPLGTFRMRVRYQQKDDSSVLSFLPVMCMQCSDAPCLKACSCNNLVRREDGVIVSKGKSCSGKHACASACPYGALAAHPKTNAPDKCDLCTHRTDLGMEPACVDVCPTEALRFGDWGEPNDAMVQAAKQQKTAVLKESAGARPNVRYIGLIPWMETKGTHVQLQPGENELIYEQGKKK